MNNKLNEKLWDKNQKLIPEVRNKLKEIVNEFVQYMLDDEIKFDVLDVNIVGSNAGFNYTDNSDIDCHLIVNFDDIGDPEKLVQAYCNQKRTSFNTKYDLTIKGIPVELYIEDVRANTLSNGIYSLYEDKWIKKPVKMDKVPEVDISGLLRNYKNVINEALDSDNLDYLKYIYNRLFLIRRNGLAINGEYSKGNQLFKTLRNDGTIDKIREKLVEVTNKELSLESLNRILESYKDSDKFKELCKKLVELKKKRADLKESEPEDNRYPSDEEMRKVCDFSEEDWKECSKTEKQVYYDMFKTSEKTEYEKWQNEYLKVSEEISNILNELKDLQNKEFERQGANSYEGDLPKKATKSSYKGFKLDTNEYHQDYLENHEYAKSKGYKDAYIAEMTPREYMDRCAKEVFKTPIEDSYDGIEDKDAIHEYAEMMKNGTDFDMPYIDVKNSQQEGRHRALAAEELGISKIPVLYLY